MEPDPVGMCHWRNPGRCATGWNCFPRLLEGGQPRPSPATIRRGIGLGVRGVFLYSRAMNDEERYTVEDLEQMTGVSRRTVRFYVQRGLLPPPDGRGRGRHYGEEHLTGLVRIQELKQQGKSLDEIVEERQRKDAPPSRPTEVNGPEQARTTRVCLAKEGVWLEVAHGVAALTSTKINRIAELCRRELGLEAGTGKRPRIMVRCKKLGAVVIPDALADGTALRVSRGQTVDVEEITPALRNAEEQDLIEIVSA